MSSKDKNNFKLKYKILSTSSNDKDYDIFNIFKNTDKKVNKPWLSEKNSMYPQEIILQIKPSKIKYLEFLSHEYTITKKIEIFISNNNKDYAKVGFFRFNDNVSTSYCARELKYVYLPCSIKCTFIKLKLHKPYKNCLNTYSQIGLYYINIIPEDIPLIGPSETSSYHRKNSLSNKKINNYNDNDNSVNGKTFLRKKEIDKNSLNIIDENIVGDISEELNLGSFRRSFLKCGKNKINILYEQLENKIKCFENLKGECVAKEEFNKANELKKIVNTFIFLKNIIAFLKGKKKKYVREENYGKAKRLKEKEIKVKIIIKNIEELKIVNDCSKKWYYEWLLLYYKELEFYEKEINKIMSNENIKNIKKVCGIFDHNTDTNDDIDLNKILLFICNDDEKKRELGFDFAYKPFEDREKKKKNFWCNNIESLCLIIRRGISDSSYNIFIKSVVILEKMLIMFQDYFLNVVNADSDNYNDNNRKYLKCIISSLLKRLDDSNLDIVDICIKTIMMMLHNNFTSFKNVFSIILSMLFYFFSADVTSEINEKLIVSLMSFYYSLINKYYTSVKNDINLKKVLEIISLFLEVDMESIKQTSLDFFVNMYNTVENSDELFEEFLLNVSFDTKNLIINRINHEEKGKIKTENNNNKFLLKRNDNNEKRLKVENESSEKNCIFMNNDELLKKNTYLNKNYLKIKETASHENDVERTNEIGNIDNSGTEKNKREDYKTLNKEVEDNEKVDKIPKLTIVENINIKKEILHKEIKELGKKGIIENAEINELQNFDVKEREETKHITTLNSLHPKQNTIDKKEKNESIGSKHKCINDEEKASNKDELNEDSTKIDENNDNVPPFTCKYCYKTDEGFTEIGLEKHWIKKCPMLCACPNCFLIVELVVIYDHFLSECSHSYMYTACEYCNKVVKKNLLDTHVMNECNGKKTEYLSCYYCSLLIESFEIDKWRAHLLLCSQNPRLE